MATINTPGQIHRTRSLANIISILDLFGVPKTDGTAVLTAEERVQLVVGELYRQGVDRYQVRPLHKCKCGTVSMRGAGPWHEETCEDWIPF